MTDVSTPLEEGDLPRLDIDDPTLATDPHRVIREVRGQGRFAASRRGLEVLAHDDVVRLLFDNRLTTQDTSVWRKYGAQGMLIDFIQNGLLTAMQGDRHDRIRRVFLAGFRARQIEGQRHVIRQVAIDLVDRLSSGGEGDFVGLLSSPYPMEVLCRIVGIPTEDIAEFSAAATQLHLLAQTPLEPGFPAIEVALEKLWDYCIGLVIKRRAHPEDDAISALIKVQETEGRVTDEELVWNIANLIFAGQDTTRYQLASSVRAVCEVPGLWEEMHQDPSLVASVAEETLRMYPVVNFVVRIPQEDVVYEGIRLTRGRRVILNVQAASRDPERFEHPDSFTPRSPGRHDRSFDVPFGLGMHYCLGASLARIEIQEALGVLVERLATIELAGEPKMTAPAGMLFGPERMDVRYTRRV
jgi:cytochrome P450